ncbi:diguanylate cyclase domain-containing protein [Roseofilum casamattae]|uniref:Diguanylate cyclase n=1 Tax=Roseofilum casamattae BLCC-M143 TaxID=3022442 RepID=A0ABT7C3C5_9CYAN|nr:diguanylate cyclase [Roseofilum casamattae]MDJ1185572.1 diguanylate cyclase [Roseofilum casamattae BLCC-M143]
MTISPGQPKQRFTVGLQCLLICFFVCVATIPILFLGTWVQNNAIQAELQSVEEKHLLLAENISGALSRYATDLEAVFIKTSELDTDIYSADTQNLLSSFNVKMVVSLRKATFIYHMGSEVFLPAEGLEALKTEIDRAWSPGHQVIISPIIFNTQQDPMLYLLRVNRDRQLAIAALSTDYIQQVQQAISFGQLGHAAIVDQTGKAIAHPSQAWQSSAKDMSKLKPVQLMLKRQTGVVQFYSPALKEDMVAGYSFVPETGWGVMIPQPYSELQDKVRETQAIAISISAIGLISALFIAWKLTVYLLNPIKLVVKSSRVLATEDRAIFLEIKHQRIKEIDQLIQGFNAMAEEVYLVRSTLENRVYERTKELHKEIEERKKLEKKLLKMATHDVLTGLPNRRLLTEKVECAIALSKISQKSIALLFLDLDGFKQVNDVHGHQVGDRLLVEISERLRGITEKYLSIPNLVFRLGGDEFVILVKQVQNAEQVQQLAEALLNTLQIPIIINGYEIPIGGSIGIKISQALEQANIDRILSNADAAMYQAKKIGNCIVSYDDL